MLVIGGTLAALACAPLTLFLAACGRYVRNRFRAHRRLARARR